MIGSNWAPDAKVNGVWAKHGKVNGVSKRTVSKAIWDGIRGRCDAKRQERKPCYAGCSISPEFADFQKFCEWHTQQIGYGLGYCVDKDLLVTGNRVYGPDTCVLLPNALNCFLTGRPASNKSDLPRGVSVCKMGRGHYRAQIEVLGDKRKLGRFDTPEEAALAYKVAKEAAAREWADQLAQPNVVIDPRVIEIMRAWQLPTQQGERNDG